MLSDAELAPFRNRSSQMAALDYLVSIASDVFIPTYYGNMAKVVEGHRRWSLLLQFLYFIVNLVIKFFVRVLQNSFVKVGYICTDSRICWLLSPQIFGLQENNFTEPEGHCRADRQTEELHNRHA